VKITGKLDTPAILREKSREIFKTMQGTKRIENGKRKPPRHKPDWTKEEQ